MVKLVLVLGDQLSPRIAALDAADKDTDVVVMAEVRDEASYVPHHPKKIAFCFAAMRKFSAALRDDGWQVAYTAYTDPDNAGSIVGELVRRAAEFDADGVIATEPGEWRLIAALDDCPVPVRTIEDSRFICSHARFNRWAKDRKALRMEYFYREMRQMTGLLMEGDDPAGGQWNYDHNNRKPAKADTDPPAPMRFAPDPVVDEVLALVADHFPDNFGTLRPFWFATDATGAEKHLKRWLRDGLPRFGDFQDAMLVDQPFLFHAVIGLYLNAGLLDPLEVCKAVEAEWKAGRAPLNAAEGFIRQIIGWREYVRGIYFQQGPNYTARNDLNHTRPLPALFWGAKTDMACVRVTVAQTGAEAYAHHIQRLMITGNFALLAGVDPAHVHEWYLAVYADAYEWVEAPNVIGMSQFADGGIIASKPYVSSGNYIAKMSDYCAGCAYDVKQKTGAGACPFNLLYWHFLDRHRARFSQNPRMGQVYATWDRMDAGKRDAVLADAQAWLDRLDAGDPV